MPSTKAACTIARSLAGVTEKDHFGSDAFYANKRIFATVWHGKAQVNVRLSKEQQQAFLEQDSEAFSEVDNAFGKQGWTTVHLDFAEQSQLKDALTAAWATSAAKAKKPAAKKKKKR